MAFQPGDRVKIIRLNREGEVREVTRPGLYRVAAGSLIITAKESELSLMEGRSRGKKKDKPLAAYYTHVKKEKVKPARGGSSREGRSLTVDLHGMTVEQATARVEQVINRAVLEDYDQVEVIHGRGTGKLKQAVTAYLQGLSVVSHVQEDQQNPGVTWAYL